LGSGVRLGWFDIREAVGGDEEVTSIFLGVIASQSIILSSILPQDDYKAGLHNEQMYSSLNGSVPTDSLPNNVHLCSQTLGGLGPRQKTCQKLKASLALMVIFLLL
jgi:hypothetical protein